MRRFLLPIVLGLCFLAGTRIATAETLQVYTKPIEPLSFERDMRSTGRSPLG